MARKVAVFVGSLRKDSFNRKLALALADLGKDFLDLSLTPLEGIPLFNQDLESDPPQAVLDMRRAAAEADGVLFVTPEYNRGLPAVLKNAVDWGSRPAGQSVWAGKAGATAGISPGAIGTAVAQSQLRPILVMLGMRLMGQPEVYITGGPGYFDLAGGVADGGNRVFLLGFLRNFAAWLG
ncbi:MAG: NAD(P)H-dependent oxidoreductase [Desulfovibrio sp.]|jgi:chromate reductase|nr:NAD(P)H-dependent oxidoreductase [Desulfovibrio sp.]